MNNKSKRVLKIMTLLATSLLIGYVSAQTYTELFMYGTPITIGTAGVHFVAGTNTTTMGGGDAINTAGTIVTFDTVPPIEPSQTVSYDQAVNITNSAGSTKVLNMSVEELTGDFATNFNYINITILDETGSVMGSSIELVSSGTNVTFTGNIDIPDGSTYTVQWVISAKSDATVGQSANLTLKIKAE
jgi:hypothetical protein